MDGVSGRTCVRDLLALIPPTERCMGNAGPIRNLDGGMECLAALISALDVLNRATGREERTPDEARVHVESQTSGKVGTEGAAKQKECVMWSEAVCERSWRAIHSGKWRQVDPAWRETLSLGCAIRALACLWITPAEAECSEPVTKKARMEEGANVSGCAQPEQEAEELAQGPRWWTDEDESGESVEQTALRWLDLALLVGGTETRAGIHRACTPLLTSSYSQTRVFDVHTDSLETPCSRHSDGFSFKFVQQHASLTRYRLRCR
jgi:hypothetical protein